MYEKLFSPGAIGTLTIPNRIVMTAASASLSQPDGTMTEDMLAYYEARAKGGFGLLFTGAFHPWGSSSPRWSVWMRRGGSCSPGS